MADRIKGITVEIGGDTTDLSKAMGDINTQSRNLQRELSDVQRLLRLDPTNTELLAQRQQLLTRQVENTTDRLNRLRSVQEQVQHQFESGNMGADAFRGFQREIQATEGRLNRLQNDMHDTGESAKSLKDVMKEAGSGIASALAGAAVGGGVSGIIEKALDVSSIDTTIDLSFDVPESSKKSIYDAVQSVTAYGQDAETALSAVRKQWQLNAGASDASNRKIMDGASAIARAYQDIDLNELIQETHEMAKGMNMTQEQAMGMTKTLLDMGFPPDQLDIISEYGQQLSRAGLNAEQIQNVFAAGIDTGTWNIDVLLDGLKEGRVKAAEFGAGVNKATLTAIKGTDISAKQLQAWGKAAAGGGQAGQKAMGDMAKAVLAIKDPVKQNNVGTQLYGTLWEENGVKVAQAMAGAATGSANAKTNQDNLNKSVAAMKADPQVRLNTALKDLNETLKPLLATVAEYVAKVADWASKNPELAAGITVVVAGIGLLIAAGMALAPVFFLMSAAATALDIGLLPLIAIIVAVIAVIGLIVAAIIYWKKHSDEIKAKVAEMADKISAKFKEMKDKISKKMDEVHTKITEIWNKVKGVFENFSLIDTGKKIITGLLNGISSMANKVWKKAKEIADGIKTRLEKALHIGSPSKVTQSIGEDTGEGLAQGLLMSVGKVQDMSTKLADTVTGSMTTSTKDSRQPVIDYTNKVIDFLESSFKDSSNVLTNYFEAIQEDGDYLNDMLTHLPRKEALQAQAYGTLLAPYLEGTRKVDYNKDWDGNNKGIYISLNSPKALDVREANKVFTQTMDRMSLMW